MAGLSDITINSQVSDGYKISFDEGICGMLFDISKRAGFFDEQPVINQFFNNHQSQVINNLDEAEVFGLLESDVLNGVVKYHIETYYNYIGKDKELYVMFADCSNDFDAIQDIQTLAQSKIFQLGIWTEQSIISKDNDGKYIPNNILSNIHYNIKLLSDVNGMTGNMSSMLSVLLFCNMNKLDNSDDVVDYRKLPNLISLNMPKISVFLGQEGSTGIHSIQNNNIGKTPVGVMGFALGCLTLVSAINSLGDIGNCDLNKIDTLKNPELGIGSEYTPISKLIKIRRNILSQKGYIILTDYEAKAGGVFFSNDQTLSNGDYYCISNNRTIHKVGRIIRRTLLPYVNSPINIDRSTGKISLSVVTEITNNIYNMLDSYMVTALGQSQLKDREVTIEQDQDVLSTDSIKANALVTPYSSSEQLNVVEGVEK